MLDRFLKTLFLLLISCITQGQQSNISTKREFMGIVVRQDSIFNDNQVEYYSFVDRISPNTPAAQTDIKVGDKLIAINGIVGSKKTKDIEKVNQLLYANLGSSISIDIERVESNTKTVRKTYVLESKMPETKVKEKIFGIGVTLDVDSIYIDEKLHYVAKVIVVYPSSPAERVHVQAGDFIIEVEGQKVEGTNATIIKHIIDLILTDEPKEIKFSFLRKIKDRYEIFDAKTRRTDISKYISNGSQNFFILNPIPMKEELTKDEQAAKFKNDRDADGIDNNDDACPDEAGVASINPFMNGCPEDGK